MTGPRLSIIPAAAAEDQAVSAPAYRLLGPRVNALAGLEYRGRRNGIS